MGVPEIEDFRFTENMSPVIEGREAFSYISRDCLRIDSRVVPLRKIDCFYVSSSERRSCFDVKIFYKSTNVESLGRTYYHGGAKRWVEESNKFLDMVA